MEVSDLLAEILHQLFNRVLRYLKLCSTNISFRDGDLVLFRPPGENAIKRLWHIPRFFTKSAFSAFFLSSPRFIFFLQQFLQFLLFFKL